MHDRSIQGTDSTFSFGCKVNVELHIVQWKHHTVTAVLFLVWIVSLLWVKLQVPHVCIVHLEEQDAVVAHSMESYVVFYLFLCLLAGMVMEFALGIGQQALLRSICDC